MKQTAYNYMINASDPLFNVKSETVASMNRVSDLIKENHEDKWNTIYMIITVILSIFIGFFVNSKNYIGIFSLIDTLMILLVVKGLNYYKKRNHLARINREIRVVAKNLGIPVKI